MTITESEISQTNTLKTLWSETLFEMLYDALQHDWSSNAIREIVRELAQKGYKVERTMKKVERRFGKDGAQRLFRKLQK
jgi:hypothetical protein